MNNFYTLIYLKKELKEKITGGIFQFAISPHKDVLECYLETSRGVKRLVFSSNSNETALFLDKHRPPKKSNTVDFFSILEGQEIVNVTLANQDRLLYIHFKNEMFLLFKLFSGSPNCYLIQERSIKDAFKSPEKAKGEEPPQPFSPAFADEVNPKAKPKNQITKLNPLLPRNLLPYLIDQYNVGEMTPDEVKAFTQNITDVLLENPAPRVLKTGELCLWSEDILDKPAERSFDTVNEAVLYTYRNAVHLRRLHSKKEGILQLMKRVVSKRESQLEQLRQAGRSLERADEYEKYGHLLMSNAHRTTDYGTGKIEVHDFYEGNEPIQVPLKEGLTIVENAEYYYDKARSSRRSYEQAVQRIPAVEQETEQARTLLDQIRDIDHLPELEKWIKDNSEVLEKFGYGVEDNRQAVSPFRKFKAGKYEIWIGKNARSNDELTSRAHKEDVWLHARGVGGSHVVIRMGNQKDYPPKEIILRAASYAAFYSKARGMKTAPVMYTKRKYVRKPKGAAPGAVVVEREQVEMVPPSKPQSTHGK